MKPFETCEVDDAEEENESENTNCTNSITQKSSSTTCCSLSSTTSSSSSNYNLYAISVSVKILHCFGILPDAHRFVKSSLRVTKQLASEGVAWLLHLWLISYRTAFLSPIAIHTSNLSKLMSKSKFSNLIIF